LFDQFGREIQVAKKPETREIAVTTIRDRWSTYPSQRLTPEKLASIFKEADGGDVYRQAELFEEMEEKDPHLSCELGTRKNAVLGLDYDILPYSESAEDKKIRDFCADVLFNLETFEDSMRDLSDAVGKGFSLAELMWATDGRDARISSINWIHTKRAVFYERGAGNQQAKSFEAPRITTVAEPFRGEEMPPFKMVYHVYKARSGYDTRAGLLRVCGWMYLFKNYALKDWVVFAEVFGMPFRLGKYEPGAGTAEKDALIAAVQSLGSDAAGIISKNTEIEFIQAAVGAGAQTVHQGLAEFCNKQISKAILGQTATTEGTPGKLGNEDAQDKIRADLIEADSEALSKTVRFQLVRPLVGYNFGWDKPLPWFKLMYERAEDLKGLSETYKNIWSIGQPISQEHVSDRFKIPLPQEGETPLPGPPAPPAFAGLPLPAKMRIVAKEITADLEASMEQQRVRMVSQYFSRLSTAFGGLREDALREIQDMLLRSPGMSEAEFTSGVYRVLQNTYSGISEEAVKKAVSPIYTFYRLSDSAAWVGAVREPPLQIAFDAVDRNTIEALTKIDAYYLSQFINNQDMEGSVMKFLQERYLEGGEGLFGRGSQEAINAFRAQFADELKGLEDWQIRRIVDTSVTRMRSLGDLRQGVLANADMTPYITRGERACNICQGHSGEIIPAQRMETLMLTAAKDPEKFGTFSKVPPYHPNCV